MGLISSIALASLGFTLVVPQSSFPQNSDRKHRWVQVGWHDELDARSHWGPLKMENKAFVAAPSPGTLFLGLDQVPSNWPYEYQWSGVTQDAYVDVARFPVLMARVTQVQGYAHMDVDVLGPKDAVVNTIRTSTLNTPGLTTIDLGTSLSPGFYHLRLRLIVGGPNEGCSATYDWVRFVGKKDAEFLHGNPCWPYVRLNNMSLR